MSTLVDVVENRVESKLVDAVGAGPSMLKMNRLVNEHESEKGCMEDIEELLDHNRATTETEIEMNTLVLRSNPQDVNFEETVNNEATKLGFQGSLLRGSVLENLILEVADPSANLEEGSGNGGEADSSFSKGEQVVVSQGVEDRNLKEFEGEHLVTV